MKLPVVVSWSGGKDSALTLQALLAAGVHEPVALLTSVTPEYDRVSIHGVRRTLLEAQARAVGLALFTIELSRDCSNAEYERAFRSALRLIEAELPAARHVAFGDLFLRDVREYRERLLEGSGWQPLFPLWGSDTTELARRFVADGFEARLVCVDGTQLDAAFAGRAFDASLLAELPPEVDPCGERGEFHTFVTAGPVFRDAVACRLGKVVTRDERFVYADLVDEGAPRGAATVPAGDPARAGANVAY